MSESFIALDGQKGVDPATDELIADPAERVLQIFRNMATIARENGSDLSETVRLVVYVADMMRDRPLINAAQKEIWGEGPYPCRTIVEVDYLGDDFVEMDGVFRLPDDDSAAIEFLAPEDAFTPTATWSPGIKTEGHVFVSGMRGINPETEALVLGEAPRVRQALLNMQIIAEAGSAKLTDATGLILYVTDEKYIEIIEALQPRFWENKPLPPMTINIVTALNDDDILEIEGTFSRGS